MYPPHTDTGIRVNLSYHTVQLKKSLCHQKFTEEKMKLKHNLPDEELDILFRTNYTFSKLT